MDYLVPKFDKNNLHIVMWFQVFLFNSKNFLTDQFDPLGQSGLRSNGNERVLDTYRTPELVSHHQMQFSFKPKLPLFGEVLPYYRDYS